MSTVAKLPSLPVYDWTNRQSNPFHWIIRMSQHAKTMRAHSMIEARAARYCAERKYLRRIDTQESQ